MLRRCLVGPPAQAPVREVLREWGRIGVVGFGGPPAHVALLRDLCVTRRGWIGRARVRGRQRRLRPPARARVDPAGDLLRATRRGRAGRARGRPGLHPARPRPAPRAGRADAPGGAAAVGARGGRGCGRRRRRGRGAGRVGPRARRAGAAARRPGSRAPRPTSSRAWRSCWSPVRGSSWCCSAAGCSSSRCAAAPRCTLPGCCRSRPLPALAWTAFKVGALSYGGGFVIVPLLQCDAVREHDWMSARRVPQRRRARAAHPRAGDADGQRGGLRRRRAGGRARRGRLRVRAVLRPRAGVLPALRAPARRAGGAGLPRRRRAGGDRRHRGAPGSCCSTACASGGKRSSSRPAAIALLVGRMGSCRCSSRRRWRGSSPGWEGLHCEWLPRRRTLFGRRSPQGRAPASRLRDRKARAAPAASDQAGERT